MKKLLSLLLSFVMVISVFSSMTMTAWATTKTATDAINWVKSKAGTAIDYDGSYGSQCVDLVMAYYNYLGVAISHGNGCDYATNTLPSGWRRTKGGKPQKGDILVWSGGSGYGHVAIYESDSSSYHQNSGGSVFKKTEKYSSIKGYDNSPYWGCIHPNFKSEAAKVTITFNANSGSVKGSSSLSINKGASIGTSIPSAVRKGYVFNGWYTASSGGSKIETSTAISSNITAYAHWYESPYIPTIYPSNRKSGIFRIKNVKSGKYLTAVKNENGSQIVQSSYSTSNSQLWKISGGIDAGEKYQYIINCNGGKCLDMTNGSATLSTTLQLYTYGGGDNKRWVILGRGNSNYSIHSVSTGRAVDIRGGSTDNGAVAQSYYYNASEAQLFKFEEMPTRTIMFYDNTSNNYLTSLKSNEASNCYTTRDSSAVTVSPNKISGILTINSYKAGKCGEDMQFKTTVQGSKNFDLYSGDRSSKKLVFRAKSSASGAKINFRWGYDSSTQPCAAATLSTSWQTYVLTLPRTNDSGSNIHPWIDRTCTIQMDNIALVDDTVDYNISIDDSTQAVTYDITNQEYINSMKLPSPKENKYDCHFVGWFTKRYGGTNLKGADIISIGQGSIKAYAHWKEHSWTNVSNVPATCTQRGYTLQRCSCGAERKVNYYSINHDFSNNSPTCKLCGTANPNYVAPTPTPSPTPSPAPIPELTQPQPTTTTPTTSAKAVAKPVAKPKSAKIKKVKSAKKAISVEWKKVSGVKGYQVQVATDKKFKKNKKTVTVKKQKTTRVTIKKLKAKKKYYVRIRTYKTVNGKKVYSSWSKVKSVKTK